ncbi:hypothetical protein LK996_16210 [Lysobacter sp. A6]|uniref:Transposase n=1 Tax=Noviluteimonas lactosilytica TaxID=2888523 RepID=A0ABS8JLV7_9GAMM|nr:hypothetical protein [Lysobacter lactosilyticus]MCC8364615.1 hypothetical protein [Lysobacter lactosilyticus]
MADAPKFDLTRPLFVLKAPESLEQKINSSRSLIWRRELELLSREKLIEIAIAGCWKVKGLESTIGRLSSEVSKHRQARSKGGQLRRADQKQAKQAIKEEWLVARTSQRRFIAGAFALKMVKKYGKFQAESVKKWFRQWEREYRLDSPASPSPQQILNQRIPAVYRIFGYLDSEAKK